MTVSVVFEGHACTDCTMWIANADDSGVPDDMRDEWMAGIDATQLWRYGNVVMACDEHCEGYFSWSSCDYCGSRLGGDRHPIVVLGQDVLR